METQTYEEKLKQASLQFLVDKLNPKEPPKEVDYLDEAIELSKAELAKVKPNERLESINLFGKEVSLKDLKIFHLKHDPEEYDRVRRFRGGISVSVLLYKFDRLEFNDALRSIFGENKVG
jgi:hypothetical protein